MGQDNATKKCPKCKEEINKTATRCSHCGSDVRSWPSRHKILTLLGTLVAFGIVLSAMGGSKAPNGNGSTATVPSATKDAKVYALNEDVRVGDVRWKVLAATDRGQTLKKSESRYASIAKPKTTTGKFVQARFEVENLGTDLKSVTNVTVVDDQGRSYVSSSDTSEWVPENESLFILDNLNPNVPKKFTAIYEVPADATGLKLKVGDLKLFGTNEALISLGF